MIKLTNEIINSTNGLSSGTYVVEDTITLSHDLTIPEDVTLIFQGGKFVVAEDCTEEVTITGTNTHLVAPICTIFGKGINVVGSWDIDRAYPQWFEGDRDVNNKIIDFSPLISKAIIMKKSGEVFLRRGEYLIKTPILINTGITLCGELGHDKGDSTDIIPYEFIGDYMVYINAEDFYNKQGDNIGKLTQDYIGQNTILRNLVFRNYKTDSAFEKCILARSGIHFDYIHWYYFKQCVKYIGEYGDCRKITNCSLNCDNIQNSSDDDIYAFDVSWLGDAFQFEHNAIHQTVTGKALRINHCGGASIQGNIINSDVLIEGCKAIVFNANHCENGMQIKINDSCVVTNNNYFHKGTVPNITIKSSGNADKSVVTMNNDMFMFLETSVNEYDEAEDKDVIKKRIENTSIYDICIDRHTILDITNVYRYESIIDFYKMYPCGISLCEEKVKTVEGISTTIYEPINEFNNYSYLASCKSQMLSNYCLNIQATIRDLKTPAVSDVQHCNSLCWFKEKGSYRYFYQIVWDETRGIKKTSSSTCTSDTIFPIKWFANNVYTDVQEKEKTTNEMGHGGVVIAMPEDINGNRSLVRLYRMVVINNNHIYITKYEYVDIPICGTQYLYDNGISVCGYKWKYYDTLIISETSDKNMEMLRINNGNVECFTKREDGITPSAGWKRGDVIHNISSSNPSTYIVPDDIA